MLFMLAGYDTTSNALAYIIYELAMYSDVQARAHEEVTAVFDEFVSEMALIRFE